MKRFFSVLMTILLVLSVIQVGKIGVKANNDTTWQQISDPNAEGPTEFMIDPLNPNHLVIATFYGSLKQSWDGGITWENVWVKSSYVRSSADNMLTTNLYWINGVWYFNSWDIIWKTEDFKKFEKIVVMDTIDLFWTDDGITIYAALRPGDNTSMAGKSFLKSSDGGKTWQNLTSAIDQVLKRDPPFSIGNSVDKLIVFEDKLIINGPGFDHRLISYNGGLTFQKLNSPPLVFVVGNYLFGLGMEKLYQSADGLNWKLINDKFGYHAGQVSFEYDKNTGVIYMVDPQEGVYYSPNDGKTWISYSQGLSDEDFYNYVYHTRMPGKSVIRICNNKLYLLLNTRFYMNSLPKKSTIITFQIGNPNIIVNGISQEIDPGRGTKPVIIPQWSRTVVPIRAIVEALGGIISWDGIARKVIINLKETVIELWIDNPKAKNYDVKPVIINDRTMLPLRFIAESLGCIVDWDNDTRTITITYGG